MRKLGGNRQGYTLVELMVALVLGAIAAAGIYSGYTSFSASYDVQEQVAEQNQNLRIAVQRMVKEIRMAGYTKEAGAGFVTMNPNAISFTILNDTSGSLEKITYQHNTSDPNDMTLDRLVDDVSTGDDAVIQNVEALYFVYLDANRTGTATASAVRFVQISLVVKTTNEDYTYTDTAPYLNLQGTPILAAQNDHFRRRLLTAEVECRNMGF